MKLFARKPPWYATGLAFECQECGRCCAGPEEGYVWVTGEDIVAIAAHLELSEDDMRREYVRRVSGRYSLKEHPQTRDCIFLRPNDKGGRGCAIYEIRPIQCRTWPFWAVNLTGPGDWARAQGRCAGINRGSLHPCDEIETKSNTTRG